MTSRMLRYAAIASLWGLVLLGCQTPPETAVETPPTVATSPQSGWQTIAGEGVSLALPAGYEGGNPSTDLDELEARLNELGSEYAQQLQGIRQNPEAIALLAFDSNITAPNQITSVNIVPITQRTDRDLATFVEETALKLEAGATILEQEVVPEGDRGRMVVQDEVNETTIQALMYFVRNQEQLWIVMYTTTAEEFEQRLPDFERSIESLSFVDAGE